MNPTTPYRGAIKLIQKGEESEVQKFKAQYEQEVNRYRFSQRMIIEAKLSLRLESLTKAEEIRIKRYIASLGG